MPVSIDPRGEANRIRLLRLKAAALGLSAVVTVGLWSLVSASVDASQHAPTSSTQVDSVRQDEPFFADQPSSLADANGRRPLMQSGGS